MISGTTRSKGLLLAAVLTGSLLVTTAVHADARGDATFIVDSLVNQTVMDAMFESIAPLTRAALVSALSQAEGAALSPAARDVVISQFLGEMQKNFLPKMRGEFVQVYLTEMTAPELSGLRAFLETPAGRGFAKKQSILIRSGSQAGARVGETVGIEAGKSIGRRLRDEGATVIADPKDLALLRRIFPSP